MSPLPQPPHPTHPAGRPRVVMFEARALNEVNIVLQHAPEEWAPTYRFLFAEGDWSQILLYNGREFRPECDQLFLSTMALTSSNFGFTHMAVDIISKIMLKITGTEF